MMVSTTTRVRSYYGGEPSSKEHSPSGIAIDIFQHLRLTQQCQYDTACSHNPEAEEYKHHGTLGIQIPCCGKLTTSTLPANVGILDLKTIGFFTKNKESLRSPIVTFSG